MSDRFVKNKGLIYTIKDGVEFIQFSNLKKYENIINHAFTTRHGGVSKNEYESLNMSFAKKDEKENVWENYKRVANALEISMEDMVFSDQIHENEIRVVENGDRGKGILKKSDIRGCDGLVTNQKNTALVTFYADCVPVFLFDPVETVIGVVHSGWRGTAKQISRNAVRKMRDVFFCKPQNILAAIGPSIGRCCFEVGDEVFESFQNNVDYSAKYCKRVDQRWHIDLPAIIKRGLIEEGMRIENIVLCDVCTQCNRDMFFSHRGDKGQTGISAGIMVING
ncbi:MAG: peptidoglycan editing factor PgeF [Clostridium sp.]|nr:peptidoglycan editing factor PgeF [Clostridium sp.]